MREDVKRLLGLLTPKERSRLLAVVFVMLVAAALQAAGVSSLYPFLSLITDPAALESGMLSIAYAWTGAPGYAQFLAYLGLGVLGLIIVSNAALSLAHWLRLRYAWRISHTLSLRLMRQYLARDYAFFLDHHSSELNRHILNEAQQITDNILGPGLKMINSAAIALAMVAVLIVVNPVATGLVLAVTGGGYVVAYMFLRGRMQAAGRSYREANQGRFEISDEAFSGIKEIKLRGREGFFLDRFKPVSETRALSLAARKAYGLLPKYVIEACAMGGLVALLVFFLFTGQEVATLVPTMGVFVFAGYRMMPAFRDLLNTASGFRFHEDILADIESTLERDIETGSSHEGEPPAQLSLDEEIRMDGVTYAYPNAREPAVQDIDLTIPKGSSIAIVGQTGAGKTTIIDLLLGLLEPQEGSLTVDGVPVHPDNVRRWQQSVGYVPQEIHLADVSVAENIAFGVPEDQIDHEQVHRAAGIAQIQDAVENSLPDGYQTVVGEAGVRLSGGQRQRIGIARALYHDPPVLVFDEATSDIDGATEARITEAIQTLEKDKTLITVAHRFNTIRTCDVIYLLDDGRIVAQGDYEELADEHERFQAMARGETL